MLKRGQVDFSGQHCIQIENESLVLWVTIDKGPRVLGLALQEGDNLFAELPGLTLDCPGAGVYHLHGGHRLWVAPEDPPRTYLPDNQPLEVREVEGGVRLVQPVEPQTGIQKQLMIQFPGPGAEVVLDHILVNSGAEPVALAPWAITQLKTSGEAFLPVSIGQADPYRVLPDRQIALWPYTDLSEPHLRVGRRLFRLHAGLTSGTFKIGFPNPSGWLAYLLGETLFIKLAPYQKGAEYLDLGSSSEIYCNDRFLESETLGPFVTLAPGESAVHRETWKISSDVKIPAEEQKAIDFFRRLGLTLVGDET